MKKVHYTNLVSSYARVLFYISEKELDLIRKEVQFLLNFFKNRCEIFTYLSHPIVSLPRKKGAILAIGKNLSKSLVNFVMVISANKRSNLLVLILEKFLSLVRDNQNELEIVIKSVEVLSESNIKTITESLNFLGKITKVSNVVDSSILGGFIIEYGFNLIDASLKSYLDRLVDLSKMEILKIRGCI